MLEEVDVFFTFLSQNNFQVHRCQYGEEEYEVIGNGVVGYFNLGFDLHPMIDFRFSFDNAGCFNKIGHCPVSYDIMSNDLQLLKHWLDFVGSVKGYEWSNSFAYLDDDLRPMIEHK